MSGSQGTPARPTTSYDDVPYESSSFPQTHPDRLAALARLFGLDPAPVDRCRVLELGCAMGANLVPMAFNLPGSDFVGVDSSARQVAVARATAGELDLTNIRIEHASILDVDRHWGEFDYLICHGVYSWVPEAVQEKILAIAAENLSPNGVAFVSYNTYPGWHMREAIRHMMRYHADQFGDIPERLEQARALIDFLAGAVDTTTYYGALLQEELKLVRRVRDSYLFHDHLEEVNAPVYFHEFIARADRHGLRYLAEPDFATMLASGFPAEVAETLDRISPDVVRAEQYMDFLRNRFFRQTLLCRAEHRLNRHLTRASLRGLMVASAVAPEAPDGDRTSFRMPDGRSVTTDFPLTRAALSVLAEYWPLALDQETLLALASERVVAVPDEGESEKQWAVVLDDLLRCYTFGGVDLRTWQAPCTNRVTVKPRVSGLVAQQARKGRTVTSQRHEPVELDPLGIFLASLLDGTHDRAALLRELTGAVARGELVIKRADEPVTDARGDQEILASAIDEGLRIFARRALLVA